MNTGPRLALEAPLFPEAAFAGDTRVERRESYELYGETNGIYEMIRNLLKNGDAGRAPNITPPTRSRPTWPSSRLPFRARARSRRLRCLRGIDTLTALGSCSEIGERERFDHPDQLASYLGIVPSERTTGSQRRLGSTTKAGSTYAWRLLVEAGYHYSRGPVAGEALEGRPRGQSPEIKPHLLARATRTQRSLAPNQRRPPQTRRDRRGRGRTRRLLRGDRHLDSPSG